MSLLISSRNPFNSSTVQQFNRSSIRKSQFPIRNLFDYIGALNDTAMQEVLFEGSPYFGEFPDSGGDRV